MTTYDDMRGYIHAHDRNGWFDVVTETTPMYQMVDKAETENAQLRQQLADVTESMGRVEERCAKLRAERNEWHRVAESKQDIIDHMRDANAENARLRDELDKWERLTANIEIPSYPITEFRPKDLERENDKLRKLAKKLKACNSSCGRCIELFGKCDYEAELRELGVESWE